MKLADDEKTRLLAEWVMGWLHTEGRGVMMPKRKKVILKLVERPKGRQNSIPVNPEDWPAMRRYIQVSKLVRKGMSEEEAVAQYDRPRGICTRIKNGSTCGAKAKTENSFVCATCARELQIIRSGKYHRTHRKLKVCAFPGCGAEFHGWKYCSSHKGGKGKVKGKPGRPRKVSSAPAVVAKRPPQPPKPRRQASPPKPVMPATWEKKANEKSITQVEKVLPVKPSGHAVTYYDSVGNKYQQPPKPLGLRDLFGTGRDASE